MRNRQQIIEDYRMGKISYDEAMRLIDMYNSFENSFKNPDQYITPVPYKPYPGIEDEEFKKYKSLVPDWGESPLNPFRETEEDRKKLKEQRARAAKARKALAEKRAKAKREKEASLLEKMLG